MIGSFLLSFSFRRIVAELFRSRLSVWARAKAMSSPLGSCVAALALYGLMALLVTVWKIAMFCCRGKKKMKANQKGVSSSLTAAWLGDETVQTRTEADQRSSSRCCAGGWFAAAGLLLLLGGSRGCWCAWNASMLWSSLCLQD